MCLNVQITQELYKKNAEKIKYFRITGISDLT